MTPVISDISHEWGEFGPSYLLNKYGDLSFDLLPV